MTREYTEKRIAALSLGLRMMALNAKLLFLMQIINDDDNVDDNDNWAAMAECLLSIARRKRREYLLTIVLASGMMALNTKR